MDETKNLMLPSIKMAFFVDGTFNLMLPSMFKGCFMDGRNFMM